MRVYRIDFELALNLGIKPRRRLKQHALAPGRVNPYKSGLVADYWINQPLIPVSSLPVTPIASRPLSIETRYFTHWVY
jgi:hypothetical protein